MNTGHPQQLSRLTPLADLERMIDAACEPVAARDMPLHEAAGKVLAEDVLVRKPVPASAIARRDGWAVRADLLADAGAYAPVPLTPRPSRIDRGDSLPEGCDAVAPLEAIAETPHGCEAILPVAPGEGVVPAAAELASGHVLQQRGKILREIDLAIGALGGIESVSVRTPRVALLAGRSGGSDPLLQYFARVASRAGAAAKILSSGLQSFNERESGANSFDAVFAFGGTGTGVNDQAISLLGELGSVAAHGIAIEPGSTAAFGHLNASGGSIPILLLPGAFDAAFAAWLLLGARMIARLAAAAPRLDARALPLARKIASPLGITGVALVSLREGRAWPLSAAHFSLADLVRADGCVRIEASHEGFAEGASVPVEPMP